MARWLGDIRTYFPAPIVRVMQQDAIDRLGLKRLLLEPELLAEVEPDVHLVATLVSLSFDTDASGTPSDADTAIQVGQSISPRVRQGTCTGVLAVVDTNDSAAQSRLTIHLTARSNVVAAAKPARTRPSRQ